MSLRNTILGGIFLLSIFLFFWLTFTKPPLPQKEGILDSVIGNLPSQESPESRDAIIKNVDGYEYNLKPLYSYDIYGLVVSLYDSDNWLDFYHKDDPGNIRDLCIVWGENITNGSYKTTKFKSGQFTCFYRWGAGEVPLVTSASSNNHVIPSDNHVKDIIKNVRIGDQIHIKGNLVNYSVKKEGSTVYTRNTSTTREDTGNHACEILYVTDINILKKASRLHSNIKTFSGWTTIISLALMILLPVIFKVKHYQSYT